MRFRPVSVLLLVLTTLFAALSVRAAESLPLLSPIFGDHMVLQRGKPNAFWGWARPGQAVRVSLAGKSAETVTAADGRWLARLEVPAPGGPYTVEVDAGARVTLHDVLVGDVWLCSGQSNMEWPLRQVEKADAEVQAANLPTVRLYQVPRRVAYQPAAQVAGEWKPCTPESAAGFSAVGYFFGRKLHTELQVPIGLVSASLGGSPAESWMSEGALARLGEFKPQRDAIAGLRAPGTPTHGSFLMHWLDDHDLGQGAWERPEYDDRDWTCVTVPGGFDTLGVPATPAVVWFRREITLPDPLPAGTARIQLGVVERMDTVFVNGRWTGASSWVENPRNYAIPAGALRPGRNVIAIRVFKTKPQGGFLSPAESLRLQLGDGSTLPLAGEWRAKLSFDARPPTPLPLDFDNYPTMPTVLYNGMIAPIAPLAIAGAIWYQGEANTSRADQYRRLLPGLIADWRAAFEQGEFPFYIAGLPAFMARRSTPVTDGWADLRDAQEFTVRNVRNTGLAVLIDTGEADNIHPKAKRPVGDRLAASALAGHYGCPVEASGPTLRFVERQPGRLVLHFDHVDGGLRVKGQTLEEFSVCGTDGTWQWAEARLENDMVVVTCATVPDPVYVRYAWQGNPRATLCNAAGLPAHPFRTDPVPAAPQPE